MRNQTEKKLRLLLTGGHAASTAFAIIKEIQRIRKSWMLYWIGPTSSVEGREVSLIENMAFQNLGVKVYLIDSGRIQRKFTKWTLISLFKIPFGFIESLILILKIKPDVTLSFGGYTAFPSVFWSWLLRIPVIIHEQTTVYGRTNIYSAIFATYVAISRVSSRNFFPQSKTVLTGNPVDSQIYKVPIKKNKGKPPVILITGGHAGSVVLNNLILKILKRLLKDYLVIHQAGSISFDKFAKTRNLLDAKLKERYFVYDVISPFKWPEILSKSDIIVSRGGANIVSQIMIIKRPAVLIPIPFAYHDEQKENSIYAKKFGIAEVLEQKSITPQKLYERIKYLDRNWLNIIRNVESKESPDILASDKLIKLVEDLKR